MVQKVIMGLILYWLMWGMFCTAVGGVYLTDATTTASFNTSTNFDENASIIGNVGAISEGFMKFVGLVLFGLNVPGELPAAISTFIFFWQTFVTLISILLVVILITQILGEFIPG